MEVDAYVFSKLVDYAGTVVAGDISLGTTLGVTGSGQPLYELNAAFLALAEAEVPENDQVIFCSNAFYNKLRNTNELVKTLRQTEYGDNVKFTIGEYEGREIIAVPANRFKTKIKLLQGGYGWDTGSKKIDFIVCAKSAIYHVTKYDKVRVFQPNVIQDFDGYKVNIRVYHDVFVPDNKRVAIYAHVEGDSGATSAVTSEKGITFTSAVASKKVTLSKVVVSPAGDLCKRFYLATTATIGSAVDSGAIALDIDYVASEGIAFKETASALDNGTYYVVGADNGMVTAISAATITIS